MTTQCCVCHKVRNEGEWIRHDTRIQDASHTYCPVCFKEFMHSMGIELAKRKTAAPAMS
jgi:hypothetical protein